MILHRKIIEETLMSISSNQFDNEIKNATTTEKEINKRRELIYVLGLIVVALAILSFVNYNFFVKLFTDTLFLSLWIAVTVLFIILAFGEEIIDRITSKK